MGPMKPLLEKARETFEKHMRSRPGQHQRTTLGDYHNAVMAVRKQAEAFDDLLAACEALRRFVYHRGGCAFIDGGEGSTCDCGLDDVEETARTAIAKARGVK